MKLDMRILNPDRNKTDVLWRRLDAGAILPTLLVTVALIAGNLPRGDPSRIIVLVLLLLIAVGHMVAHKKIVRELKRRSGISNKASEDIAAGAPNPQR